MFIRAYFDNVFFLIEKKPIVLGREKRFLSRPLVSLTDPPVKTKFSALLRTFWIRIFSCWTWSLTSIYELELFIEDLIKSKWCSSINQAGTFILKHKICFQSFHQSLNFQHADSYLLWKLIKFDCILSMFWTTKNNVIKNSNRKINL